MMEKIYENKTNSRKNMTTRRYATVGITLAVALIAVFGCVYNSTKSKYIQYIVEVDKLGHVAPTSGPLQITPLKIKE